MKIAITLAAILAATLAHAAEPVAVPPSCPTQATAGAADVQWHEATTLPKGAQISVLSGDPASACPFVLRLKLPAGYEVPAHSHPNDENVTVLSGDFHAGMGDKLDRTNTVQFSDGGFKLLCGGMNHYAWASSETIVQVHGDGPFTIVYVDPADDPGKPHAGHIAAVASGRTKCK